MWSLISFLVTYTGFFEYLFLNSQYSRLYPKTTKNTGKTHCREAFLAAKMWRYRNTSSNVYHIFYIHVKLVTHFFLYLSLKWRYTACKTLCFASVVEFIAACPLCLHGSAVKIALCYAQSINRPIATCVNFGLQISPNITKP